MKKHILFILAAAMLLSLFTFVSCEEQTVNDVLDAALAVVEALPDAEDSGDSSDAQTETDSQESDEVQPETSENTETAAEITETEAPEEENAGKPADETEAPEEVPEEPAAEETAEKPAEEEKPAETEKSLIDENGWYDDKDNVALYIHTYGKLPGNYVSKNDAEDLYGWEGGALDKYAQGMAIGGSKFGNYEGLLPKKKGRQYYECDIDTVGTTSRGAKRIVYSNDGLIYYTDDHYETFELLYGEE